MPEASFSRSVADVSVDGSADRLNVTRTVESRWMPVAPAAGETPETSNGLGAVTVNDHDCVTPSVAPSVAAIVAARRAVYVAPAVSATFGVNVAVRVESSYATVAATAPPGPVSVNVVLLTVVGSSEREKVARGLTPSRCRSRRPRGTVRDAAAAPGRRS